MKNQGQVAAPSSSDKLLRWTETLREELVRAAVGTEPSHDLVETIHAHAEGNPFFLTEVIRLFSEQGGFKGEGQSLGIPE